MTKTILIFVLCVPAWAQLTQAAGDDFTVAIYNDTHTERVRTAWTNSVDWLLGANGRGPGGISAISYWNIKAIGGVGDYVSTGSDDCDTAAAGSWTFAAIGFGRLFASGLPQVWSQGNHDICAQYTSLFAGLAGVSYGSSTTLQSRTFDVSVTGGTVRLGLLAVGVVDDMASGQPSRTFVDAAIAASQSNRQWILMRHVGTFGVLPGDATAHTYPADGDAGWCADGTQCLGYGSTAQWGTTLRDTFYKAEPRVYFGVHGHNGGFVANTLPANDGHTVHVTGHLGASGGTPGWITLMKFRPSHNDVQVAIYQSSTGLTGDIGRYNDSSAMGPFTWAWTPQLVVSSTQVTGPAAIRGGVVR